MGRIRSDDARDRRRLRQLAGGDLEALAEIYDAHASRLYGMALWLTGRRVDAEDVVQETMLKLAAMGADLLSVRRPGACLLRMVRNAVLDRQRRAAESGAASPRQGPPPGFGRPGSRGEPVAEAGGGWTTAEVGAPAEEAIDLRTALARLPAEQREVVYLHAIEGLTFREVGRVTEVSTFTAASRYRLALGKLKEMLESAPACGALPEES